MKKIKDIYLDDGRLVLIDYSGKQYRIDSEDYSDPRFVEIDKSNIYHIEFSPITKQSKKKCYTIKN